MMRQFGIYILLVFKELDGKLENQKDKKMLKNIFQTVLMLSLFAGISILTVAQTEKQGDSGINLRQMEFENVIVRSQGVRDVFTTLALRYNVPVGLELALNSDDRQFYRFDFPQGKLPELLDLIIGRINWGQNQYSWSIDDGVVHIVPQSNYRDPFLPSILETKIKEFSSKKDITCDHFIGGLINRSEVRETIINNGLSYRSGLANFSGMYFPMVGREFSLTVTNRTVKEILDQTVKESQIAKIWSIYRSDYEPEKFTLYLNARYEDSPVNGSEFEIIIENMLEEEGFYY
jgi:hypothetical protein